MSQEQSCYSTDQEYFLDVCRGGDLQQLKQFVEGLSEVSTFDWEWVSYSNDNFMHMLAGNNHYQLFDYLYPILNNKCTKQQLDTILNKQNSSGSTPLHYCVITDSKQMAERLIKIEVNTNIQNQHGRTPFQEAQKFQKYLIAQLLAPVSKTNLEALKSQIGEVKLNDSSDSEDEEQQQTLKQIKQQKEEMYKDQDRQ